ncbi:TPA: SEC10/PgrA surface exclusion domain-containing protein [Streptococcus suis]|nr:SEC10/PgrA surface exclusion domain-containing protein [Streptococcus suis]
MSKKLIKSTSVALAASVAVLGQHVADANEVTPTTATDSTAVTTAEVAPVVSETAETQAAVIESPVSVEQVQATEQAYVAAQAEQTAQEQVVVQAEQVVTESATELATEEEKVVAAEATIVAAEAAPQVIENLQAEVATQEATVITEKANLVTAHQVSVDAKEVVEAAVTDKSIVDKTVAEAQATVSAVEEKLVGTGVDTAKETVSNLEKNVQEQESKVAELQQTISTTEQSLSAAQAGVETAKATVTEQLANEVNKKEVELAAKQTELAATPATTETTSAATSVVGSNKITLPATFKTTALPALKAIEAAGYTSSPAYTAAVNQYRATIDNATQTSTYGAWASLNSYKSIAADQVRTIDPNNLSTEVQNEIALFTAELLNGVRSELGLSPVAVTTSSQEFAKKVTTAYNQVNQPTLSHNFNLIGQAAVASGLRASDNRGYESLGDFGKATNVDQLKRLFYISVVYMLFNDSSSNYGHTISLLQDTGTDSYYLGATSRRATSSTFGAGSVSTNIYMVPSSNITSTSFSRTAIGTGTSTVSNVAKIESLKAEIASLESTITNLRNADVNLAATVVAANQQVANLQTRLSQAKSELVATQTALGETKQNLGTARSELSTLELANQSIVAELNQANTVLSEKLAAQSAAQSKVEAAQTAYDTAVAAETAQAKKVEEAKAKVVALKAKIAENEKLIEDSKALVGILPTLKERVESLKATLAKNQETLAAAKLVLDEKIAATNLVKAEYDRLVDLLNLQSENSVYQLADGTIIAIPNTAPTAAALPVYTLSAEDLETIGLVASNGNGSQAVISPVAAPAKQDKKTSSVNTLPNTSSNQSYLVSILGLIAMILTFGLVSKKNRGN